MYAVGDRGYHTFRIKALIGHRDMKRTKIQRTNSTTKIEYIVDRPSQSTRDAASSYLEQAGTSLSQSALPKLTPLSDQSSRFLTLPDEVSPLPVVSELSVWRGDQFPQGKV